MQIKVVLKVAALGCSLLASVVAAGEFDAKQVDAIFARTSAQADGVYRYGFPRSDLNVVVDGVTIKSALALGGWVAFRPAHGQAAIMGDLVVTESEANPVMTTLLWGGIQVTALHNHLLRASPPIFYMHVAGHGEASKLAETIRAALALTKTPPAPSAAPSRDLPPLDLDAAKIDEALGTKGKVNGGVYQFSIPRADRVAEGDMVVPSSMGSANVINFQPTGDGKAAIAGDIAALGSEVVELTTALRANGIEVAAIHNHMLNEEPRTFYVHFWAHDDAVKLAVALRAALDKTNVSRK
ncbi:DUF1259 domain-containing protein [Methylocystis suflitae]|uniref:DUF1259 domain-containing protein n=1 Tax=Methylocystis suflitae TaxID=2951405 RepID=UPI00210AF995|nr:DUF1259 domain-containing protein [Methylocystis suflitae]MCQ4191084.1 DUF1259 domain-containing protein [Methylocystis suflitae]